MNIQLFVLLNYFNSSFSTLQMFMYFNHLGKVPAQVGMRNKMISVIFPDAIQQTEE